MKCIQSQLLNKELKYFLGTEVNNCNHYAIRSPYRDSVSVCEKERETCIDRAVTDEQRESLASCSSCVRGGTCHRNVKCYNNLLFLSESQFLLSCFRCMLENNVVTCRSAVFCSSSTSFTVVFR